MYKVMIVEDELLVRAGVRSSINWDKYDMTIVNEASNGQAALDYFLTDRPDVVLTDIKMPVMDGLTLIKKIRELSQDTKIVILSCVEDFHLAKEAIKLGVKDYILKLTMTTEEMENVLNKIKVELDQMSDHRLFSPHTRKITAKTLGIKLLDYLLYDLGSTEEISALFQNSLIPFEPCNIYMVMMKVDQYESLQNLYQDEQGQLIQFTLLNVINEILTRSHMGFALHESNSRFLLLFGQKQSKVDTGKEDILMVLEDIRQIIKNYFNVSTTLALSEKGMNLTNLKSLYRQCHLCFRYEFFLGTDRIIQYCNLNISALHRDISEKAARLFQDIENGEDFKNNLLSALTEAIHNDALNSSHIFNMFINTWIYFLQDKPLPTKEKTSSITEFIHSCYQCRNYSEVITLLEKNLHQMKEGGTGTVYSREIIQTIHYIRNNYSQQITLKMISDNTSLSPNYLSNLFKKELHVSLFEYLNRYRIEKAIELLMTTNAKTYEVAYAVGFSDESYFSKTFKKYTGKRPNDYKKVEALSVNPLETTNKNP